MLHLHDGADLGRHRDRPALLPFEIERLQGVIHAGDQDRLIKLHEPHRLGLDRDFLILDPALLYLIDAAVAARHEDTIVDIELAIGKDEDRH